MLNLPKYKCHKVVGAVKILDWDHRSDDICEVWYGSFRSIITSPEWLLRAMGEVPHTPDILGGYLVQYENGHLIWSPAEAFEAGYSKIDD